MSELQLLFLILAAIYLWECTNWLGRGSVAFLTRLGRRWRPVNPAVLLGNQRGGLILAWPLPPLGTLLSGNQFPLSLSADAVLSFVATSVNPGGPPQQTGVLFRFDEIQAVSVKGKKVLINGRLLLKSPSSLFAAEIAEKLRALIKLDPKERGREIENMVRESFDTKAIRMRWDEMQKQIVRVRRLTNLLFVYIFAVAPAVIWFLGLRLSWPGLVAGLLGLTTATAISFRRIHKLFYPAAEDERFTHFLTVLLSPATTIRAGDLLTRPLLEAFHPLAIAKVFCDDDTFQSLAERILRDIRHPAWTILAGGNASAPGVEREARKRLQNAVEQFLARNGIKPEELIKPPARSEESCRSYCPRCLAQFTTSEGACVDCGGIALASFPARR